LWGLHRDVRREEEALAHLREQLGKLQVYGPPRTKVPRKILSLREGISQRIDDTTDFMVYLQQEIRRKRGELVDVEKSLRFVYAQAAEVEVVDSTNDQDAQPGPRSIPLPPRDARYEYDLFISHATEDKGTLVGPLVERLRELGLLVWYDELELSIGDSLRRSIDHGLTKSRFGLVVLSPSFLKKQWTTYELDSLVSREMEEGKVILPIWHRVTKEQLLSVSPRLVDKVALRTDGSTDDLALDIAIAVLGG
jgi:hypothetical protein